MTNIILSVILAVTTVISLNTMRRLWWMRCQFNERQELKTVFDDSFFLGMLAFSWFQVLLLSSVFEFVRGSPLVILHLAGLIAQIIALNLAYSLRVCTPPYVLNLNTLRELQALRQEKAKRRAELRKQKNARP